MAGQHREFLAADAEVVAIAHAPLGEVQAYVERNHLPFPVLSDPDRRVFDLYGVSSQAVSLGQRPGLFVVDAEGVVQFAHIGRQQWEIPAEAAVLERVRCLQCRVNV